MRTDKGKNRKTAGTNVLLGVTGCIAAYKAADLASKLAGQGCSVRTILTASACEFVRPKTFEALTGGPVYTSLWAQEQFDIGHISLADWADIVVLAPATANIIGKMAVGVCDDLLSTTLCVCWEKPILIAPAMNTRMWRNPIVQENVKRLKKLGAAFIGQASGRLACGDTGEGRMTEPADILGKIIQLLK